jgi:hypothetical protein
MPYSRSPGESSPHKQFEKIVKLLQADGDGKWNRPLAADELWEIGRESFEPLFDEPPLGPIPEYLKVYGSVHGCVAEYEEKIDELERWKVEKLELWLKGVVGRKFTAADKVYVLLRERGGPNAADKYLLKLSNPPPP